MKIHLDQAKTHQIHYDYTLKFLVTQLRLIQARLQLIQSTKNLFTLSSLLLTRHKLAEIQFHARLEPKFSYKTKVLEKNYSNAW